MLKRAVDRYPEYAPAHSMLAFTLLITRFAVQHSLEIEPQLNEVARLAARAAELDESDPWAHIALGFVAITRRRTDEAVEEFNRALALNPNFAAAHGYLGLALAFDGRTDEAIENIELAMRLSPHDLQNHFFNVPLAIAHYLAGRYAEAISFSRKSLQRTGWIGGHRIHIASLAQAGRIEDARNALQRLKELQPNLSVAWIEKYVPYTTKTIGKFVEGMRKAGLE
jgi:tetratricopeptide (TPR) repeat protein